MNETLTMNEKTKELLAAATALLVSGERAEDYIRLREAVEAVERCATRERLDWILARISEQQERHWPSDLGTPNIHIYESDWPVLKQVIDYWQERNIGDGNE